jgi:hypothetical protein
MAFISSAWTSARAVLRCWLSSVVQLCDGSDMAGVASVDVFLIRPANLHTKGGKKVPATSPAGYLLGIIDS